MSFLSHLQTLLRVTLLEKKLKIPYRYPGVPGGSPRRRGAVRPGLHSFRAVFNTPFAVSDTPYWDSRLPKALSKRASQHLPPCDLVKIIMISQKV